EDGTRSRVYPRSAELSAQVGCSRLGCARALMQTHRSATGLRKLACSPRAAMLLSMRASGSVCHGAATSLEGPTCGCRKRSPAPFHSFRIVIYNGWRNSSVSLLFRDAGALDHRRPFADVGGKARLQLLGRARLGLDAKLGVALLHLGRRHDLADRLVQELDDVRWRPARSK